MDPKSIKSSQESSPSPGKSGEDATAVSEPLKNDSDQSTTEKKKDLTNIEAELMKKDIQLQKAIELLKTWKVFKELRPL